MHIYACPSTWPNVSSCSFPSLCCLPSSSLVSRSPLFSLHSSPGGDYDWHDTNVSTSCSAAHRQGKKKRWEKQSLPSPVYIACSLPHRFSQQVDGVEVSHPVTSQLSACLMAAQVSAPWIRLGSYWLADSLSLSNVAPVKGESARVCGQGGSDLNWIFAQMEINPKWTCTEFLLSPIFPFVNQSVFFRKSITNVLLVLGCWSAHDFV